MAVATTIIPFHLQFKEGGLYQFNLARANSALRMALQRSPLRHHPVVGGVDFSFNEDTAATAPPHWQPHWQLCFLSATSEAEITGALTKHFHPEGSVRRPVRSRIVDDPVIAISYTVKSVFFRRVSYIDKVGRRNTRSLPLRPKQQRELALFLDGLSLSERLFFRRIRRAGDHLKLDPTERVVSDNSPNFPSTTD